MNSSLKYVIGFFFLVLTAAAALYIVGSNRARHSTSLLIDAPPSTVWPYLTEAENLKKWVSGLIDIVPVGEIQDELGARAQATFESNGQTIESEDEFIRYEKNKILSVKAVSDFRVQTTIFELESRSDGQTYLTMRVRTANRGIGKFTAPFVRLPVQEKIENDSRRLKDLIERQTLSQPITDEDLTGTIPPEDMTEDDDPPGGDTPPNDPQPADDGSGNQ